MKSDWPELTKACIEGMRLANLYPGRYGGRYVARDETGIFIVLVDDDPDLYNHCKTLDIMAHAQPDKVYALGRARSYLHEDGSVTFQK